MVYLYTTPLYNGAAKKSRNKEAEIPVEPNTWMAFKQLNTLPNGGVTVQTFDDQLLSVQPGGQWETRALKQPDGTPTQGQYEVGTLNGGVLAFNPNQNHKPFVYPCVVTVV